MHHIAVMKKSWSLIPKILSGEKTIESRWYVNKSAPWNRITTGDTVWFKNSGEPVIACAKVQKVIQGEITSSKNLRSILKKYGGSPGICFTSNLKKVFAWTTTKRYYILIFLHNTKRVKPFTIDKTGYGNACAWMCVCMDVRETDP